MKLFIFLANFLVFFAGVAQAEMLDAVDTPQSRVELYADVESVAPGEPFWLIFRVTPIEGWHSYWKNPGDSGLAPIMKWQGPDGTTFADPLYPVPHRVPYGPLMNYGYEDRADLLVRVDPPDDLASGETFAVTMDGEWLICADQCIPQFGQFAFDLPVGGGTADADNRQLFAEARAALPQPAVWSAEAQFTPETARITVFMSQDEQAAIEEAYVFPHQDTAFDYAAEQSLERSDEGLIITVPRFDLAFEGGRLTGVLAIADGSGRSGFKLDARVKDAGTVAGTAGGQFGGPETFAVREALSLTVIEAIAFALIGGLILNLMPCVFPVLSLKAMALMRSSDRTEQYARLDGLAYTAGIVISFLLLAGLLLALRAAGEQIGWGFQLQAPLVIGGLALLLFVIGLNFAGFFEFGGSVAGIGQSLADKGGLQGSFFTGVLATIVATPCTAPFMASALGFAMIQPAGVALAIFASLGLGLALPFLLVAFIPGFRRALPKPGPWMVTFRQALAFPLFLTVIWLVWVLGQQAGIGGVTVALTAMLALAFLIWLYRKLAPRRGGRAAALATAALLVAGLGYVGRDIFLPGQPEGPEQQQSAGMLPNTETFSEARLEELQQEGRPVFVYFTAAWCVTCKANERVALDTETVKSFIRENNITVLKGDWTNRDDTIAAVLDRFGRSGVPLYLFYGGDQGAPRVLPQVLTPSGVVDAMRDQLERGGRTVAETST